MRPSARGALLVYLLAGSLYCAPGTDDSGGEGVKGASGDGIGVVASEQALQHHDIEPLPSGNVLAIVWDSKTPEEAIEAGRRPELVGPSGL